MNRRWRDGLQVELDGLRFRVVAGRKSPDDLRLECWVDGSWRPVRMALGAFLADFFYENEEVLFPYPKKGGRKYLDYLRDAAKYGWEKADAVLRVERAKKRAQPQLDFGDMYDVYTGEEFDDP